ncbi:MAG: prepilin-type N-terminal cleavage/methylation domain-containing protein [Planctomycetes bacterium]|nr:prepilin-type N-terminal cleavage/methylation domain-containing protein [Planctomycetota bacterium]
MPMPMWNDRNQSNRAGFTLIEIMLALAVLGVGLTVLLGVRARTLRSIRGIERAAVAQSLTERLLTEQVLLPAQVPGAKEGRVEDPPGYSYRITTRERDLPPANQDEMPRAEKKEKTKARLYEITATITYGDGGGKREFSLTALWYDQPVLRQAEQMQP